jgi:hypothetical protein
MDANSVAALSILLLSGLVADAQTGKPSCHPSPVNRTLEMTPAEQVACFEDWLARGMPRSRCRCSATARQSPKFFGASDH